MLASFLTTCSDFCVFFVDPGVRSLKKQIFSYNDLTIENLQSSTKYAEFSDYVVYINYIFHGSKNQNDREY